jgi:predicted nucleotidyltransferase
MRTRHPNPRPQLVEILFGAYRRQILGLLLLRPDESFYVREIARITGVSAGSLHRELKALTDAGLLARTTVGNQVRYQADQSCPIFEELAGIFRKTAGLADVLRELLAPLGKKVSRAFIFGSVAQGKSRPGSDVDLLVVGSVPFADVVEACHAGTARLGREVNPVVITKMAFQTKFRESDVPKIAETSMALWADLATPRVTSFFNTPATDTRPEYPRICMSALISSPLAHTTHLCAPRAVLAGRCHQPIEQARRLVRSKPAQFGNLLSRDAPMLLHKPHDPLLPAAQPQASRHPAPSRRAFGRRAQTSASCCLPLTAWNTVSGANPSQALSTRSNWSDMSAGNLRATPIPPPRVLRSGKSCNPSRNACNAGNITGESRFPHHLERF